MMTLKKFQYDTLNNLVISPQLALKLSHIYELRGKQYHLEQTKIATLERLVDVAKIQSTDSSNRIEGIYTSDTRLKQLMERTTRPHNRSEEEISGYREVLNLIHDNYHDIPINTNTILGLHKQLFRFTNSTWGGSFKDTDNQILTQFTDGTSELRFSTPAAHITPILIAELCESYNAALQEEKFSPLLICAAFIFDFVSIHPFRDGNGRMSRLLMLLSLYQNNFDVGKYISLEKLIEETKSNYYETLAHSSIGWHENTNSYEPFLDYFLSIVLQAYRELEERVDVTTETKLTVAQLIINHLKAQVKPLSKSELITLIPQFSQKTIERGLKNLRDENKIEIIGKGRSTKYILKLN